MKLVLPAIALSWLAPFSARGQHYQPPGTKGEFVTSSDGVRIHCLAAGPRSSAAKAPAILFVPGWTMPAEIWEPQIAHFSKSRRVVAMDPRSQGLSTQATEGHYPEARARDIKAVVDQLKLAPVVLVGWSMGVPELAAYVDQFGTQGVAGLVLVDGLASWPPEPGLVRVVLELAAQLQRERHAAAASFVREMYRKPQSEEYLDRVTRASLRTPTNTAMALLLGTMAADRRPALAKINKPTLIVAAEGPFQRMIDDMHQGIPGSRLEVFENAGHALFVDEAVKFNAVLEEFLKRL